MNDQDAKNMEIEYYTDMYKILQKILSHYVLLTRDSDDRFEKDEEELHAAIEFVQKQREIWEND